MSKEKDQKFIRECAEFYGISEEEFVKASDVSQSFMIEEVFGNGKASISKGGIALKLAEHLYERKSDFGFTDAPQSVIKLTILATSTVASVFQILELRSQTTLLNLVSESISNPQKPN